VAFLKVDSQTILTIQNHVITKNHRISITNTEKKIWQLKIREVKTSDRGWYMCQINTDPMKSQMGYLNVVGIEKSLSNSLIGFPLMFFLVLASQNSSTRHSRLADEQ
jgi:hypothetical protein